MSGYEYSARVLASWADQPRATVLTEKVHHLETNLTYWRARALSAERRMQEHHCEGEQ